MVAPGQVRRVSTPDLTTAEVAAIRDLMVVAFGSEGDEAFTDDDWEHAIGGLHFVLEVGSKIVGHASVVERELHVDGRPFRTGYVEAVATAPARQGEGLGSLVMAEVTGYIRVRSARGDTASTSAWAGGPGQGRPPCEPPVVTVRRLRTTATSWCSPPRRPPSST